MNNPHQKALVKLLKQCHYRHHLFQVFADFMEMAALSIANAVDLLQAPKREERYMQLIGKYEKDEQQLFPKMLGELVEAMEVGPADVLGSVFGELELGNSRTGQFFTPFELCRLMARMTLGDGDAMREKIRKRGFITASEPACGAGAQILALAEAMQEAGINYQQHLHVTAVDVDSRAVHMAYLQLSLAHVPAVVVLGNSLTLEEHEHWHTPAHLLGLWETKLHRGYALGSEMDGVSESQPIAPSVPIKLTPAPSIGQLEMFAESENAA